MPEYLSPGVYVEEIESGLKPIEGVSTSTAGFLGLTERGPTEVRLVTGFEQFQSIYGGYIAKAYMAYAVDGFFRNGGQRCFIGRVVCNGARAATLDLSGVEYTVTIKAVGEGGWGNRVAIRVEDASLNPSEFKLTVAYWTKIPPNPVTPISPLPDNADKAPLLRGQLATATVAEVYDNLSGNTDSRDYFGKRINGISALIKIEGSVRPPNTDAEKFFDLLAGGLDSSASPLTCEPTRDDFLGDPDAQPGQRRGLSAFKEIGEISIVYVPDLHLLDKANASQLINDIVTHCETLKYRFAVLEAFQNTTDLPNLRPPKDSEYAAFYYPWIKIFDPVTKRPKLVPPGGHIVGIYARNDQDRGVHRAPANEVVRGAKDLEFKITEGEQYTLNPRGVNVIRTFPAKGILVWGGRTTSSDPDWKYINVRRLLLFLEKSIEEGTQWVVFELNNEKLWERVRETISEFLIRVWKDGVLAGTKREEAFFVKCDRTTMTQDDIDNGRLICIIGVAPVKPAEFVIFRIGQWRGVSAVTE
jgi:phage tail sheath protein FI